jgi:hypothetical protein
MVTSKGVVVLPSQEVVSKRKSTFKRNVGSPTFYLGRMTYLGRPYTPSQHSLSFDETFVACFPFGWEYIVYCEYESLILRHNYLLPNQTDYRLFKEHDTKERNI